MLTFKYPSSACAAGFLLFLTCLATPASSHAMDLAAAAPADGSLPLGAPYTLTVVRPTGGVVKAAKAARSANMGA